MKLEEKVKNIKMLLLDVDGVLTDGSITLGNNEIELISFNIHDGFGIKMAQQGGIKVGIITGRSSEAVVNRAKELKLDEIYQGRIEKILAYNKILNKYKLKDVEVAFIGDDLFDLPVINRVGFSVAVSNARDELKKDKIYNSVAESETIKQSP